MAGADYCAALVVQVSFFLFLFVVVVVGGVFVQMAYLLRACSLDRLTGGGGGESRDAERLARNMTFFRENGRGAPELNRIQQESGRMWVRFHGGTDPGFLDLGTKGRRRRDPEADDVMLVRERAVKS